MQEVKVQKSRINFWIWFIPFLSLVIGLWMIYKYYSMIGPTIKITFKNSGGLEPGVSQVKFRDVKVGVVKDIKILKKGDGVVVYIRMNKDVKPFLNSSTKFWIVKPEIAIGKIKGLDALMSGSYIQMYAKVDEDDFKDEFVGLSKSPLQIGEEKKGSTYEVISKSSYDLSPGVKVYYKQMEVGKIKRVELADDKKNVKLYLFIRSPYDSLINSTTKFWNMRNFTFNLTDRGLQIQSSSLAVLLSGGIGFETIDIKNKKKGGVFYLYSSKEEALRKRISREKEKFVDFILRFDEGVGYLDIGASVRLDGFVVGRVKDIISYFDTKDLKTNSLVIASIDVSIFQNGKKSAFFGLREALANGLVAKLEKVNPLVDYMYIKLTKSDQKNKLIKDGKYYIFPTKHSKFDDIGKKIKEFLEELKKLPLKDTISNLNETFKSISKLSNSLDEYVNSADLKKSPKFLNQALFSLKNSLNEFRGLMRDYKKDSTLLVRVQKTLEDIDFASKEFYKVLKKIKKEPNSLVFGDD